MKKVLKMIIKNKKILSYICVICIAIFICIPLFSKYMDISRDDGIQHICRLIGTFNTFKQGNLFPVIMSDFCNGFGYSWNIFYSPLTAYIPLIFKVFTSSFVVCLKLFMFTTIALSGIFMYQFIYKLTKSYKAGVISAVLYMGSPYHLTDLYNRIAIAELASFIFLPIVFNGMYDLFHRKNKMPIGIILGAIGLILSHNIITIYTVIFCFLYALFYLKKMKSKEIIKKIIISILIILLCTSFYWIPLFEHKNATDYEVFLPNRMYKDNTLIGSKLTIGDLFISEHFEMNFHIGFAILVGMIFTFYYRKKLPKRYREFIRIFLIFGIISVIMTLKIFPFEYMPSMLKMIQFTWRMMEFVSFFFSIIAGIGFANFMNYNSKKEIYAVVFIVIYVFVSIIGAKKNVEIPFNEEKYLQPVRVTELTGRVHAGLASFEYLPQKAFQNRSYLEQRTEDVLVLEGETTITEQYKDNTNLRFKVENTQCDTRLELPYIYYLGYKANLEKNDGSIVNLKIEESENGFCEINIQDTDAGMITISYTGTVLMKVSYILTGLGILVFVWLKIDKV